MSAQGFGSILSERFNTEKTHMQFSHDLLLQRINAMFKIIFIFMLLFLALASLTTINHLFLNQFITEHRNTFSLTKKKNIKGQCFVELYPHKRIVNKR